MAESHFDTWQFFFFLNLKNLKIKTKLKKSQADTWQNAYLTCVNYFFKKKKVKKK